MLERWKDFNLFVRRVCLRVLHRLAEEICERRIFFQESSRTPAGGGGGSAYILARQQYVKLSHLPGKCVLTFKQSLMTET